MFPCGRVPSFRLVSASKPHSAAVRQCQPSPLEKHACAKSSIVIFVTGSCKGRLYGLPLIIVFS